MKLIKLISIIFLIVVVANIILFALHITTPFVFWVVLGLCALVAYILLPTLKSKAPTITR